MVPCLSQHLNRHVIRYHIPLNQCAHKLILRIRGCRKPHLNFLKAHFHQHSEKLKLFLKPHRLNQRLISVS